MSPIARTLAVFVVFSLAIVQDGSGQGGPRELKPLFSGDSIDGWVNPFDWGEARVEDGVVYLTGEKKFFLVTEKTYGDFILELEVNVPVGGNSGIQFRSHYEKNRLWGYQAEVDPSERKWSGGLYDEGRRGWLEPLEGKPEAQAAFKNGEWNRYRIQAIGDSIEIFVNGVRTVNARDCMTVEGHIALQHHGEKGKTYRFRNVRLADLGRRHWEPLFDGKSLDGWHPLPGGSWSVEKGSIVGRSPKSERRHGLLVTDRSFEDFAVRAKFRVHSGDSGFYFRIQEVENVVGVKGFQVEVDSSLETGGLYETMGRAWVVKPDAEVMKSVYKPGEWSDLQLSAHGGWITVKVNGKKTAELKDDPGRRKGPIALQLHGGQVMHVEYKDIEVLSAAKPVREER